MGVDANTYGLVSGVQRLVGDLVPARKFTTNTTPTKEQVERELDMVAADLNRALQVAGYTVKVDNLGYPIAYDFLTAANNYGAAARVLGTLPGGIYDPATDPNDMSSRQKMYENHLKHALSVIGIGDLVAGRAGSRLSHVYSGSSQGSDGTAKAPMFTRNLHVYPGARSNAFDE